MRVKRLYFRRFLLRSEVLALYKLYERDFQLFGYEFQFRGDRERGKGTLRLPSKVKWHKTD